MFPFFMRRYRRWIRPIQSVAISVIVTLATIYAQQYIGRRWERPDIEVVGVLPLHLDARTTFKDEGRDIFFHDHKLGLVFKIKNDSAKETTMNLAIIEGCVHVAAFAADTGLLEQEKIPKGATIDEAFWKSREKATERISVSGGLRDGSAALLPAYGTTYVPVLFPFPGGGKGARFSAPGTVSLDGNCARVEIANTQPSIADILDIGRIHYDKPKGLRSEFKDGRLRLALFAGNERVTIEPTKLLPLRSISWDLWQNLDVARMYENPDELFPPSKSVLPPR